MDAAARIAVSDDVMGREDLLRGGRGRAGGDDRREALEFLSSDRANSGRCPVDADGLERGTRCGQGAVTVSTTSPKRSG